MPALFGWQLINFWQAVGILVLSKILFGGFRGRPGPHMYWRRRMMERWDQMTPRNGRSFVRHARVRFLRTSRRRAESVRRSPPTSYFELLFVVVYSLFVRYYRRPPAGAAGSGD
jgi:hypothetical protein